MIMSQDQRVKDMVSFTQSDWASSILDIANYYRNNPSNKEGLEKKVTFFVDRFYTLGAILKPTLATDTVFRDTKDGFLSYFRAQGLKEDSGFALKDWKTITLNEMVSSTGSGFYQSGGQMQLIDSKGVLTTAEYTFFYPLDDLDITNESVLKASWHHNSLTHKN